MTFDPTRENHHLLVIQREGLSLSHIGKIYIFVMYSYR